MAVLHTEKNPYLRAEEEPQADSGGTAENRKDTDRSGHR